MKKLTYEIKRSWVCNLGYFPTSREEHTEEDTISVSIAVTNILKVSGIKRNNFNILMVSVGQGFG